MIAPKTGMGLNTQQVIWGHSGRQERPHLYRRLQPGLFNYATTDQVLKRVDAVTVTAQPEGPAVLTYDEAEDRFTGSFTLSAGKYAEITAVRIPENAEVTYRLPGP